MLYSCAPLEGLTGRQFRKVHQACFPGADRYYMPFLSPAQGHVFSQKELRELDPDYNRGIPVIPQLLTRRAEDFVWAAGELAAMGYPEVNLNLGCPSGTVTAKGKGSGFLAHPNELAAFFDEVFSKNLLPVSVKTRLGYETPEEIAALLDLYNRYPIACLTVHPRVRKEKYRGPVHLDVFADALANSRNPVCYNGDLRTVGEVRALEGRFPEVTHVMIGRGLVADPALARKLRGGKGTDREELTDFLAALYQGYTDFYQGQVPTAAQRMREVWFYLIHLFDDAEKLNKQLRRFRTPAEYERIQAEILASCPIRSDVQGDLI